MMLLRLDDIVLYLNSANARMPVSKKPPPAYAPLDTQQVPTCFTRFPAGISLQAASVENALDKIAVQASDTGSQERRRALIRHSNPYGNAFAICHGSANFDRLVLLSSIVEIMWIHDDVTEELDHETACKEHALLSEVLQLDVESSKASYANLRQSSLAEVLQKAIEIDTAQAPEMIETLKIYLDSFDNRNDDFDNMKDYTAYRISNCGYWLSSYFIRWGMGIVLSEEDYESIRLFDWTLGNVLGLTNDYFSWNVEKNQPTDRIRNAVRVLMKEHGVGSDEAQKMLLGIIVEEECKAVRLKQQRLLSPVSDTLSRYLEAIELYVGGSCYWHSTAPRYQVFE